jgi:hypothetical protein
LSISYPFRKTLVRNVDENRDWLAQLVLVLLLVAAMVPVMIRVTKKKECMKKKLDKQLLRFTMGKITYVNATKT